MVAAEAVVAVSLVLVVLIKAIQEQLELHKELMGRARAVATALVAVVVVADNLVVLAAQLLMVITGVGLVKMAIV